MRLIEWQFIPRWQSLWIHTAWDEDYEADIVWFGFAFWQFRFAKSSTPKQTPSG